MQSTVFSQVIKLIPRQQFEALVRRHKGDHGVRRLSCWTWFGALLLGQLTGRDSIRSIERVFDHGTGLRALGFSSVRRSTLADANQRRPLELLEDVFFLLLEQARQRAPSHQFRFRAPILALDASVIYLSLKLMPWARFDREKASMKLHTAINLQGDLPEVVVLDRGKRQDMRVAREEMAFSPGTLLIFDKGYSNFGWYKQLTDSGVWFVTRMKDYAKFKVIKSRKTDRSLGYICDQEIYITGTIARRSGLGKLRRISFRDPGTGKKFVFMTNRFDLATKTICDLYKARWSVELFFKTIKQNLKLKKFLGTTANAVYAQVWVALIAYLLIQIIRFRNAWPISTPSTMAVLTTLLFARQPLELLLGQLHQKTRTSKRIHAHRSA